MNPKQSIMVTELTKRQEKVLKLYLAGYTPTEIGKIMNIHMNTVCSYKRIIMDKWGVENNIELIIEAVRKGYIEIEEEEQNTDIVYVLKPSKMN